MFSHLNKILFIVILGLCGWLWVQYQSISSLKAENQAQAQTIATQSNTILALKADIDHNRKLTAEITKQESELRGKTNEIIKSLPPSIKQADVYRAAAPDVIVEFLRQ